MLMKVDAMLMLVRGGLRVFMASVFQRLCCFKSWLKWKVSCLIS